MVRLEEPVLVRTEFLQLSLKKLTLLSCDGLLVENQDVGDVVVVDLVVSAWTYKDRKRIYTFSFKSFKTWARSRLRRFNFFKIDSTLAI